jgi:hypothetical protein
MLFIAAPHAVAQIPNLKGDWQGTVQGVVYDDVTDSSGTPFFATLTGTISITHQQGRSFAGTLDAGEGDILKLTGVILPDNQVEMQTLSTEDHTFFRGTLSASGKVINGSFAGFDNTAAVDTPSLESGYFTATLGGSACAWNEGDYFYCRDCGPCAAGEGNCRRNSDCASGLQCVQDVGGQYGFGAKVDVCESP